MIQNCEIHRIFQHDGKLRGVWQMGPGAGACGLAGERSVGGIFLYSALVKFPGLCHTLEAAA
jgi:hypothetical protein